MDEENFQKEGWLDSEGKRVYAGLREMNREYINNMSQADGKVYSLVYSEDETQLKKRSYLAYPILLQGHYHVYKHKDYYRDLRYVIELKADDKTYLFAAANEDEMCDWWKHLDWAIKCGKRGLKAAAKPEGGRPSAVDSEVTNCDLKNGSQSECSNGQLFSSTDSLVDNVFSDHCKAELQVPSQSFCRNATNTRELSFKNIALPGERIKIATNDDTNSIVYTYGEQAPPLPPRTRSDPQKRREVYTQEKPRSYSDSHVLDKKPVDENEPHCDSPSFNYSCDGHSRMLTLFGQKYELPRGAVVSVNDSRVTIAYGSCEIILQQRQS